MNQHQPPIVVGIHFGTTNICIATLGRQDNQIKIIPNEYGFLTSPNRVSFLGEDTEAPLIGNSSKLITFPQCTVFDIKKIIGRKFNDQLLQNNINFYPFGVVEGPNSDTYLKVESRMDMFAPELVASFVFGYAKQLVYMFHGLEECEDPADIVTILSVPNYFNDEQKEALKDSCEFNNVTVLDICRESQCACYAYELDKNLRNEHVMTLSMGGTSLLLSIEYIDENGNIILKEYDGDVYLGGDDFDNQIVKYCCTEFKEKHNVDIRANPMKLRFLKSECEKAKIKLSTEKEVTIRVKGNDQQEILELNLTRSKFEEINKDLFDICIKSVEELINQAKITKSNIRNIILMGGSFSIPMIQQLLRECFSENCEMNSNFILNSIPPEHTIAYGSALFCSERDLSTISKRENSLDINPVSVGIEIFGCVMKTIIERNSFIPCKKKISIAPCAENQKKLLINILEGEYLMSKSDKTIGSIEINLEELTTSSFDIEFEIELSYTLQIQVYLKNSSTLIKSLSIPNYFSHLNPEDIFEMVKNSSLSNHSDKTTLKMIHQLVVPSLISNPHTTFIQLSH